jgi:hypothetical protein
MSARDCMQPVLQLEKPSGLASGVPAPAASGLAKACFGGSSRLPHQIERKGILQPRTRLLGLVLYSRKLPSV